MTSKHERLYNYTDRAIPLKVLYLYPGARSRSMWPVFIMGGHVKTLPGFGIGYRANGFMLQYAVSGTGWIKINNNRFEVPAGHLIFHDLQTHYEMGVDPANPWEIYWFCFNSGAAHHWIEALECDSKPVLHVENPNRIISYFKRIINFAEHQPLGFEGDISVMINRIISDRLKEHVKKRLTSKESTTRSFPWEHSETAPHSLQKTLNMIAQRFTYDLNPSDIARNSGISVSHLFYLFRTHLNMSPMDCVWEHRLRNAQELLQHTDMPVKVIAFRVGISDSNLFSRHFRQATQLTPSEYRIKMKLQIGPPSIAKPLSTKKRKRSTHSA